MFMFLYRGLSKQGISVMVTLRTGTRQLTNKLERPKSSETMIHIFDICIWVILAKK